MKDDIVDRLRTSADLNGILPLKSLVLNEAANEILQLRMTLRDHFAAAALQGMTGMDAIYKASKLTGKDASEVAAIAAYEYADAMIKAREVHP